RVGDPVPVVGSDGSARLGADLVAMTIGSTLRGYPTGRDLAHLTIAHPAGWGPYEASVLHSALTCTEAEGVPTSLVSNPLATVNAAVSAGRISRSETVVLADVGTRGTEVALVTNGVGEPGRLEATSRTDELCSAGFDRALARHVLEQVRAHLPAADLRDPANRLTVSGVLAACRQARDDLVQNTSAVIDVRLPDRSVRVRVVRAEFESLATEPIRAGISTISHLMNHARENGIEVDAIVLTGEAARTPLLTEMISAQWPTRVVIPPDPEWATTRGAAHIAIDRSQPRLVTPPPPALASTPRSRPARTGTDNPRKWTLRLGAVQLTAALIPIA
ncbi:MAG: Hsp70 family protein, partial [Pseudonocardiaceae bacterium]